MLGVALCGEVAVDVDGRRLPDALLAGRQGRLVLAYLTCERHRSVPREELADLLWGDRLPASWPASLSAVISKLRRLLTEAGLDGPASLPSAFGTYRLHLPEGARVDWEVAHTRLADAEQALAGGDAAAALVAAAETEDIARRGFLTDDCRWVDDQRGRLAELRVRAVQLRAEAQLLTGERVRAVEAAREALALEPVRESGYRILMRALAAAGERGEALRVWEQCRTTLVEELGTDPAPDTEAVYLDILREETTPSSLPSGVVTFLLTDIVGSSGLWERHPTAMAVALARHDELVDDVARAHGGQLLKAKLEGDATVSVFPRATSGALAALALRAAIEAEPWPEDAAPQVRMALHTGEAFEGDGDFFGPALNRAARLRSLAGANQILVSQALAELVRDHLPADTGLRSLGHRDLRGLSRGEHVFELAPAGAPAPAPPPLEVPPVPVPLVPSGPFVGREPELEQLSTEWDAASAGSPRAAVIGGEPGVGKTRLAAERAQRVHDADGLVLYGRCDEDLGAPYQPFSEAFRTVLPTLGAGRLASVRGIEEIARLVPEVADVVADLKAPTRTDPDAERYVLFDAVARLLVAVSAEVPVLLVLDDLHWATKPTLLMLRHILRNAEHARLHVLATYRTTDLDPAHPLSATLTDLHRDGTATRLVLGGLGEHEVTAYLGAAGYEDDDLATTLASVTSGNPFFLLEVLRHLEETGGRWDPTTLPQGVREAVGRRLTRLSAEANEALLAGAVVGGRFALDLVERVVGRDLVDAVSEACDAELVVEERGGWFRFNHDIVRRSLLAGVASVKRVRLHQRIAAELEDDDTALLADLAHHYFESAWAGNAAKAVEYCRRAADQAMAGLAYEGAADLYDRALQAMEIDDRATDDSERAELLLARCEALLAAGDVTSATDAVARLEEAAAGSPRLAAWATCFAGQLAVLIHPDQLDTIEGAVAAAAEQLAELGDAAGEAKAHTVRASCLARLGRHADCETALDRALTAARRGDDHRRVNAVLAGAPLAALWGPNPVPRAGGRCLDVIRLLRITTGSPAVEATSTRCQAVLEAFRGRGSAARRMLDNARRTLTELGLRHALLEVDLFAGVVELVDGDAAAAEVPLRRAYAGFRRMGVDADAAQAAAVLARACVELGRDGEADELCADSERLGGNDLKASIAWRAVRAQLLSRRGEHAKARELAEAAVAVAERTDALVDHGDACLSLATVLDAAGDNAAARRAADAAVALYERKGAIALVGRAHGLLSGSASGRTPDAQPVEVPRRGVADNQVTRLSRAMLDRFAARDWDGLRALSPVPVLLDDRRTVVGHSTTTVDNLDTFHTIADLEMTNVDCHVLATRGERLALSSWVFRNDDGMEVATLLAGGINEDGTPAFNVLFDPEDLDTAFAELDRLYLAGEAAPYADVWRRIVTEGRITAVHRLARHGAVVTCDGERPAVLLCTVGDRIDAQAFPEDQLDAALARFDDLRRSSHSPVENACTRAMQAFAEAYARRDWAAIEGLSADFVSEWRGELALYGPRVFDRDGALEWIRSTAEIGVATHEYTPLAVRGDRLALFRVRSAGREGPGQVYAEFLFVIGLDRAGTPQFQVGFDPAQLDEALTELDARYLAGAATASTLENACTRAMERFSDAYARRDWDVIEAWPYRPDYFFEWRGNLARFRPRVQDREGVIALLRAWADVGIARQEYTPIELRGEHLALFRLDGVPPDGSSQTYEKSLFVVGVGEGDVAAFHIGFDPEQLDDALEELDKRYAGTLDNLAARTNAAAARAFNDRDRDWIMRLYRDELVHEDRRKGFSTVVRGGDAVLDEITTIWALGSPHVEPPETWAVRGERLGLFTYLTHPDRSGFHLEILQLVEVDDEGRTLWVGWYDPNDPESVDAAYAELEARYLAGEAAAHADAWRVCLSAADNFNTRSRNSHLAADAELVDHRPVSFANASLTSKVRDAFATWIRLMPDVTMRVPQVYALAHHGAVTQAVFAGTAPDTGPVESSFIGLIVVRGDQIVRMEQFADHQLAHALARFEQLAP